MIYYSHGELVIRTAAFSDIDPIASAIRREDAEEIFAEGCASVQDALARSFENSTFRLTVERRGVPLAMFGLVPDALGGSSARVWFLGAKDLSKIKKSFMRLSRMVIGNFLSRYPALWNRFDVRYTKTGRWLKWLGAEFGQIEIMGDEKVPFQIFVLRRS